MTLHVFSSNPPAYLDAKTKIAWSPLHLPPRLQRAFRVQRDVIALTTQSGTVEEHADVMASHIVLKSGVLCLHVISRKEIEEPFDIRNPGKPQSVQVWNGDGIVLKMMWNPRGVFQLEHFKRGPWINQIRKALTNPDLRLI